MLQRHPGILAAAGPALIILVAVFGVEGALHSVHHLSDDPGGASCVVASASAQLAAVDVEPAIPPALIAPSARVTDASEPGAPARGAISPAQGRAPPFAAG
jgi:hypothetical protein